MEERTKRKRKKGIRIRKSGGAFRSCPARFLCCTFMALALVFAMALAIVSGGETVWAGSINAEEQRVIDFYNQTFTYNGKSYVATDAAKAAAYNKLVADDVDLTKGQVDSMILQAKNNIASGIAQGYLVEVTTETEETEAGTESTGSTEAAESGSTETEEQMPSETEADTESDGGTEESSETVQSTETNSEAGTETGAGSGQSTGTGTETDTETVQSTESGTSETASEAEADTEQMNGSHSQTTNKEENSEEDSPLKIDINDFIGDLINEGNENVTVTDQSGTTTGGYEGAWNMMLGDDLYTVQQYSSGKVTLLKSDGTVLYQSSLPVKNTGYVTAGGALAVVITIAGLCILAILAYQLRHKKNAWLILPLAFTVIVAAALAVGGKNVFAAYIADWKTVWIAGSPQYEYTQETAAYYAKADAADDTDSDDTAISRPLRGSQYGEISCERLELDAPLYYGDDDELLEIGVGTYTGGYLPGENGTILIGGHDTTYFAALADIETGDILTVKTGYGEYQYQVTGTQIAEAADTTAYEIQGGGENAALSDEELILYTCYPFSETGTLRSQRFFVYAERVEQ